MSKPAQSPDPASPVPAADASALDRFDPIVRQWFLEKVGIPTEAQALAWPRIAAGEHVLVSAPTGSGKTLTAFLWAIDRLLTGAWPGDRVRVLYVSPLRALNTDVRRNLEGPLRALRERFGAAGRDTYRATVMTRSGDTPPNERRKMVRHPPEILVTTPESLNILLTSRSGRQMLGDLRAVILDEIHAIAPNKRGTHLMTAVERLVELSGEIQRIGLSATLEPMERVAEMLGGYERLDLGPGTESSFRPRPVSIVRAKGAKRYDVKVRFPVDLDPEEELDDDSMWQMLARDFRKVVLRNRSTLLFANSRRMTEKAVRLMNQDAGTELAYSHHGSLSREVRSVVEKRLKNGELKAIVATNSLELGIDIGELDEVLLVQTPPSVASAVQRIGRSGHGVGQVSRGTFYPTFGRDLIESAVVARAVVEQDIEELEPVVAPLDVLAQVLLSMVVAEPRQVDDLYDAIRTSWPYRHLSRRQFDLVLDMLTGRYADSRIRELRPRVHFDRVRGRVSARPGVERMIYMSGGTIADRGYFSLRLQDGNAKLGELDEEFVWERSIGDTVTLGTQSWQIRRITHNDVIVAPARGPGGVAPFWRADARDKRFDLCQKIAAFLERAESRLKDPAFELELRETWKLEEKAASELLSYLGDQREATGGHLPRRDRLLVERCGDRTAKSGGQSLILHTCWGGRVNRPMAMALQAAWDSVHPDPIEVHHDDYCLMARVPEGTQAEELFALLPPDQVETLLRARLERTGFFGSRFRWAAGTAMLLPRGGFRQRTPLWLSRQRAKKLLESVRQRGDFPMVVEAWRTCLRDEFELDHLKEVLTKIRDRAIPIHEVRTDRPSPLAAGMVWQYTNQFMYEDDTPENGATPGLRQDVLQELVHASHLRPRLPVSLCERFRRKAQRLDRGYAPAPGDELALWLLERLLVPAAEWRELLLAVLRDHSPVDHAPVDHVAVDQANSPSGAAELTEADVSASVADRVLWLRLPGQVDEMVVAVEALPRLASALGLARADLDLRPFHEGQAVADDAGSEAAAPSAFERLDSLWSTVTDGAASRAEAETDSFSASAGASTSTSASASTSTSTLAIAQLVGEWLRFYGPVASVDAAEVFGLAGEPDRARFTRVVETLQETQSIVVDELSEGTPEVEICDAENVEILLRWLRTDRRPAFEPRAARELALFLAFHQGLTHPGDGMEDLQERLERLFGLALPAGMWEGEVLPARMRPYYPAWLDSAMQQSELTWIGAGKQKTMFGFPSDLELFLEPEGPTAAPAAGPAAAPTAAGRRFGQRQKKALAVAEAGPGAELEGVGESEPVVDDVELFFGDGHGRGDVSELAARAGLGVAEARDRLWSLAWEGKVSCDAWLAVRQGLATGFQATAGAGRGGAPRSSSTPGGPGAVDGPNRDRRPARGRRAFGSGRRAGWQGAPVRLGRWFPIEPPTGGLDALEREELVKDRVRLLLGRYGLLCRELLTREAPALQWSRVFRTLRLMELAGEVVAGYFFRGIRGLQFLAHGAFRQLEAGLPQDGIYWLCAADPASLCGVDIEGVKERLPKRLQSTHLVYHGTELVLVSRRRGKLLDIRVPADHPRLVDYWAPLEHLLGREVSPLSSIRIEKINGEAASKTEYARKLDTVFRVTREGDHLRLWKRYGGAR